MATTLGASVILRDSLEQDDVRGYIVLGLLAAISLLLGLLPSLSACKENELQKCHKPARREYCLATAPQKPNGIPKTITEESTPGCHGKGWDSAATSEHISAMSNSAPQPIKPQIVEHETSAAEIVAVARLRALIDAERADTAGDEPTYPADAFEEASAALLLRYVRARNGDVDNALKHFVATRAWRRENDVGRWIRAAPGPFGHQAVEHAVRDGFGAVEGAGAEAYPNLRLVGRHPLEHCFRSWGACANFGHAKDGSPIYYERTGAMARALESMVAETGEGEGALIDRHVWQQELMEARMEEASTIAGWRIDKQVGVLDMSGLRFWPGPAVFRTFKASLAIDIVHYPETLSRMFIVNAPWAFAGLWKVVKPWIDPITAAKVLVVKRGSTAATLLRYIDKSQLPAEYGGSSTFQMEPLRANRAAGLAFTYAMYSQQDCQAREEVGAKKGR